MGVFSTSLVRLFVVYILICHSNFVDGSRGRRKRPIVNKVFALESKLAVLAVKLNQLESENRRLSESITFGHGQIFANTEVGFYAMPRKNQHVKTDVIVLFNHVITTLGNAYDGESGTFTCPLDGTYLFNINILSSKNSYIEADIMRGRESKLRTISYNKGEDSYSLGSGSAILKLSTGDVIKVKITYAQGKATVLNKFSYFSGYLLHL